jgi:hypothetical protein
MRWAFAASAAVMSGDQAKCVKIGDLEYEGHMSRSLDDSPNSLPVSEPQMRIQKRTRRKENAPKIEDLHRMRLNLHTPIFGPLKLVKPCLENSGGRCLG